MTSAPLLQDPPGFPRTVTASFIHSMGLRWAVGGVGAPADHIRNVSLGVFYTFCSSLQETVASLAEAGPANLESSRFSSVPAGVWWHHLKWPLRVINPGGPQDRTFRFSTPISRSGGHVSYIPILSPRCPPSPPGRPPPSANRLQLAAGVLFHLEGPTSAGRRACGAPCTEERGGGVVAV